MTCKNEKITLKVASLLKVLRLNYPKTGSIFFNPLQIKIVQQEKENNSKIG
jgi:hypothetical protein